MATSNQYRPMTNVTLSPENEYTVHLMVYLGEQETLEIRTGDPYVGAGTIYIRYKVIPFTGATTRYFEGSPKFTLTQSHASLIVTQVEKNGVLYNKVDSTDRAEPAAE